MGIVKTGNSLWDTKSQVLSLIMTISSIIYETLKLAYLFFKAVCIALPALLKPICTGLFSILLFVLWDGILPYLQLMCREVLYKGGRVVLLIICKSLYHLPMNIIKILHDIIVEYVKLLTFSSKRGNP